MTPPSRPRPERGLVTFDLATIEPAERWELELLLGQHHVASRWRGTSLVLSAAHRDLVVEFLDDRVSAGPAPAAVYPDAVASRVVVEDICSLLIVVSSVSRVWRRTRRGL